MIKIFNNEQLMNLKQCPIEVIKSLIELIQMLDENYGEKRDGDNDLGGYVLIAENIVDIKILKQEKLQGLVSEYTDIIECSKGVNYTSSLFLL